MPFLAPAFGAIAAFAGTAIGQIVIGVAGSLAVSLLQGLLTPPPTQQGPAIGGVQIEVQLGETGPLAFPMGYSATAGTRRYQNSWGQSGNVPNAFLVEVRQISDIPISGIGNVVWINGQRCTILTDQPHPDGRGFPVSEYRKNGIDHVWVKSYDGTQTEADPYLVTKFSGHPDYPWLGTAIGTGCAYVIVTALWDREVWSGSNRLDLLFEPGSALFYDLRKDSTNGGSGSHRWNNPATWEPSDNPVVVLYNVIRGIFYGSEWVFGGRDVRAFQLPASSWIAAANECDVLMPLKTVPVTYEKQFRCGAEIFCDNEPLQVIQEILAICNGRLSEIGGIFEILVGAPGAAVYSFTDDDIVITRGQRFTPSPGLNETHNAISYSYPEPTEVWASKDGPTRYYPTFEAEDGGRRLARGVVFNASPFGEQNQRLANTLVLDDRRWRTHEFTLPPDAWILTGTSVVNWTSERNGYVNKKFLVYKATGEAGMCQPVVLREIDPSDWSWNSDWQLPNPTVTLTPIRPGPQTPTGFQAFPATFKDADGTDRRPSIQITYDGNMPDIQSVQVLVRLKSSGAIVYEGFIPFEPPYSVVLNGVFLPNETYLVSIRYVPISARETLFTSEQEVVTPDVKLVAGKDFDPFGDVDVGALGDDIREKLKWFTLTARELMEAIQNIDTQVGDQEASNAITASEIRREVSVQFEEVTASFEEVITAAIIPLQQGYAALSDQLTTLDATVNDVASNVTVRGTAMADPGGGWARWGVQVKTGVGDIWSSAAMYLDTNGTLSRAVFLADQFIVAGSDGSLENPLIYDTGGLRLNVANIGFIRAGRIENGTGSSYWDLNTGGFRLSTP